MLNDDSPTWAQVSPPDVTAAARARVRADTLAVADLLRTLDRVTLTPLVRRALRSDTANVIHWTSPELRYDASNPVSMGVHRVQGTAAVDGQVVPWSLVLKIIRSPAGVEIVPGVVIGPEADDVPPDHFGNWKREIMAYSSGLLDRLPAGLTAPRCYGITEVRPRIFWLWLEDAADGETGDWPLSRYATTARHLGRFNGAYLTGEPLPADPWLGPGWLRSWMAAGGPRARDHLPPQAWQHPVVRRHFSADVPGRLATLVRDREGLLYMLDRLPRTLCHRDAFPANLFVRRDEDGRERTVAIDWAFAGIGPVGEEIAPLIAGYARAGETLDAREVKEASLDAYIQGLAEAGWRGDPGLVRLGCLATAALRYAPLTAAETVFCALDNERHDAIEERWGQPIEIILARQAARVHFLLDLADEARELMAKDLAA